MAAAGGRESRPEQGSAFKTSLCSLLTSIPLTEVSRLAKASISKAGESTLPQRRGWGPEWGVGAGVEEGGGSIC